MDRGWCLGIPGAGVGGNTVAAAPVEDPPQHVLGQLYPHRLVAAAPLGSEPPAVHFGSNCLSADKPPRPLVALEGAEGAGLDRLRKVVEEVEVMGKTRLVVTVGEEVALR